MSYKDNITATFNRALLRKLGKEARKTSTEETSYQTTNNNLVEKRRYIEDAALAKELGVSIKELTENTTPLGQSKKPKDRVDLGLSPSCIVEEIDCTKDKK
tara:strand:+ start:2588 stop:2890 length:303 start_codon:yes stop_codon:yes gene_type:complete